ncbi:hypothetical protein ABZZ20_20490 [Streptomyces sp. NPDC006430]|uniref:hypothetical protein n=1 Tax=Streptomyces sp. NPDC006430 TaxID=3154299 RepID=UPI0033B2F51D
MNPAPRPWLRPQRSDPADGLCGHAAVLRTHAVRLRAAAQLLDGREPQADAFRAEVAALADRCATAADGLAAVAAQLQQE